MESRSQDSCDSNHVFHELKSWNSEYAWKLHFSNRDVGSEQTDKRKKLVEDFVTYFQTAEGVEKIKSIRVGTFALYLDYAEMASEGAMHPLRQAALMLPRYPDDVLSCISLGACRAGEILCARNRMVQCSDVNLDEIILPRIWNFKPVSTIRSLKEGG